MIMDSHSSLTTKQSSAAPGSTTPVLQAGCLIVNADDWGRDRETTDRTLECSLAGALSSVSAMVFMEDSERAAELAGEHRIDAGLHLNLTLAFSGPVNATLSGHQERISRYLRGRRVAQALFHPGLAASFAYVVAAQLEEFARIYGQAPGRIDGHHHMHLAANVMFPGLLPEGIILRRNFSFQAGEKGLVNRAYRGMLDGWLGRRHLLTDYFFSLPPLETSRLERMALLAKTSVVEAETHPINPEEHHFLCSGKIFQWMGSIAPGYVTRAGASR